MLPLHYTMIERDTNIHQQPLTIEQISAMYERAFGAGKEMLEVQELDGGECNNTYRISFTDAQQVILRVSPAPDKPCPGRAPQPMRNEHYFQPFLAPIATLIPKTLLVDFTHQLINRDYMFQTFMEGARWSDIVETFTSEENSALWQQMGHIAKTIHSIEGETFGSPVFGTISPHWSTLVINGLIDIIQKLEAAQVDATDIKTVLAMAEKHSDLLDEIRQPRLLHGDLWTFNLLIKRDQGNPRITAVLDSDGCSWGDPMEDWTMFLLHIKTTEGTIQNEIEGAQAFWQAYGQPERSKGALFRDQIYRARNFAGARLELHIRGRNEIVLRTYDRLREILVALHDII
jgi:aminoglycoside phosphotransferase (APT) family kinase protein